MFGETLGDTAGLSFVQRMKTRIQGGMTTEEGNLSKGGGMGIAIAGTIAGQALSGNSNSAISTLGTGITAGANAAMVGSMMPSLLSALPEVTAFGAAVPPLALLVGGVTAATVAFKGIVKLMDDAKAHNDAIAASYKASSDAISIYGGSTNNATQAIYNFNTGTEQTNKTLTVTAQNVAAISKLKPTDSLRQIGDLLKGGTSASSVIGTVEQFAAAQVANGMDPAGVAQMVTDLLTYAGQTQYLGQALKEITANTKDVTTATETWLNKLTSANGFIPVTTTNYKQLNTQQQAFADGLLQITNSLSNSSTPLSTVVQQLKAMGANAANTTSAVNALAAALTNAGQAGAASQLQTWNSQGMNMPAMQEMLMLNNAGPQYSAGLQDSNKSQLVQSLGQDLTSYYTDQAASAVKTAQAGVLSATNAYQSEVKQLAEQTSTTTGLTSEQAASLTLDNAKKKTLEAQLATMKLQTQELEAQKQYNLSQADLDNQIRLAQASGDFLQAGLLQQQKYANTDKYNNDTTQQDMQNQIDSLTTSIDDLNSAVASFKAQDSNQSTLQSFKDSITTANAAYSKALDAQKSTPGMIQTLLKEMGIQQFKVPGKDALYVQIVPGTSNNTGTANLPQVESGYVPGTGSNWMETGKNISTVPQSELPNTTVGTVFQAADGKWYKIQSLTKGSGQGGFAIQPYATVIQTTKPLPGHAMGGLISGPGSGTSDSILAMLSNGEFVQNASAVSKYGVSFMNSINSGTYRPNLPAMAGANSIPAGIGAGTGEAVYNINVNVMSNADADEIAKTVMNSLQRLQATTSTNRRIKV